MKKPQHLKIDKKKFLYPKEFQQILDIANESQKFNLLVMINTGARINEARHIERTDIDDERKSLVLRVTKVKAISGEKRPSPRIIALSTQFHKYLRLNINKYKMFSTTGYRKMIQTLTKEIKVKDYEDLSSHNVRKTFGTWMLALGIDGFKLSQHLGHDPNTLIRHYASPDIFNQDDKDRMREILGDLPTRLRN